jgi:hypothetical protein
VYKIKYTFLYTNRITKILLKKELHKKISRIGLDILNENNEYQFISIYINKYLRVAILLKVNNRLLEWKYHSYLSASTGFNFAAFLAGK